MKFVLTALCLTLIALTACEKKEPTMMVHEAQSFETATGTTVGAVLVMLHNTSGVMDELVKIKTPLTSQAEIHNMTDDNGIMKMREVESILIPASGMVSLTPDGYHIMLMDLDEPLKAGDKFEMTFYFKNSAPVTATIPVLSRKELQNTMEGMEHHDHH